MHTHLLQKVYSGIHKLQKKMACKVQNAYFNVSSSYMCLLQFEGGSNYSLKKIAALPKLISGFCNMKQILVKQIGNIVLFLAGRLVLGFPNNLAATPVLHYSAVA